MLSKEQVAHYREQDYLKVAQLFTPEATEELTSEIVPHFFLTSRSSFLVSHGRRA